MTDTLASLQAQVRQLRAQLHEAQARMQALGQPQGQVWATLQWRLGEDGSLVLSAADALASRMLERDLAAQVGSSFYALFPGLRARGIGQELADLARQGGVWGPRPLLGDGLLSARAYHAVAWQSEAHTVVLKFWDRNDGEDAMALRLRAQEQMSAIFSQSPTAISLTRIADGTYVDVNARWCALTGLSLREVSGRTSVELGFWPDPQQRQDWLLSEGPDGRFAEVEVTYQRFDGERRILQFNAARVEIAGEPFLLCYLRDVSEERHNEAEVLARGQLLRAAKERLEQQVRVFEEMEELAAVGYWMARPDSDEVVWSAGLYALCGLPVGSVHSLQQSMQRIDGRDQLPLHRALQDTSTATVVYRWLHPDSRLRWVKTRISHHVDSAGQQWRLGVAQDITAEREASLALQDRLQFIQKITARAPGVMFQLRRHPTGQYQFLYVADPMHDIYCGLRPEQALADVGSVLAMHHPDDQAGFVRSLELSAHQLSLWQHEYRLRLRDGDQRWLLGQAMPEREADGGTVWSGFVTDITDRRQAQERLQASEARFRALTDLSSDWYWEQDAQFRFVRIDGNMTGMGAAEDEKILGHARWEIDMEGVSASQWAQHRADLFAHRTFHDFQYQRRLPDGSILWASISGAPVFDAQGRFTGYRGIGRNITERKRDEDRIERLAFYDPLTGLPNRRLLMDRLHSALALRERDGSTGALLFIDLDNFKDLNDTRGHDVGDELLKQVAIRLSQCVREADTVARLGGDEFVVMLQMLSPHAEEAAADVEAVGRKVLAVLNQPFRLGGIEHHSTPSMGVAMFQHEHVTIEELLKRADLAMYQAKAAGRNTLRFFDPAMQAAATARASVEADLRQALVRDELVLYYQPVVDALERTIGVDALVRWVHPTRGIVSPGEFIPVAEQTGLVIDIGLWVLRAACQQLVLWSHTPHTRALSISVNVSARQFRSPGFTQQVLDVLRQTGANPYRLKLELTESLLLTDFADVADKMSELRSIGVSFSLDDFGTGYSSLSYLKQLPLDHLKIDQSFVRGVLTDPNDAAIARTILTLAASLDLGVVAEGVEITGQRDFLMQHGCRSFQGYLFGRPVPVQMLDLRDTASSRFNTLF
ncbi:MAG: sensor domain-containing protein [Rhodoferax sp.]